MFPGINAMGGDVYGIPVLTSANAIGEVIAVIDAANLLLADDVTLGLPKARPSTWLAVTARRFHCSRKTAWRFSASDMLTGSSRRWCGRLYQRRNLSRIFSGSAGLYLVKTGGWLTVTRGRQCRNCSLIIASSRWRQQAAALFARTQGHSPHVHHAGGADARTTQSTGQTYRGA